MRRLGPLTVTAVLAAGCGGAPMAVGALPGSGNGLTAPLVVRAPEGWVLPWEDQGVVHLRLLGDDGAASDDRVVAAGALVGAAALADGVAVAVADEAGVTLQRPGGAVRLSADVLSGRPAPGIASDGATVLLITTQGGEIAIESPRPLSARALLVAADGSVRAADLGQIPSLPSVSGDPAGFIVASGRRAWLIGSDGAVAEAPGTQIGSARLFRRPIEPGQTVTSDEITRDGARWLKVPGLVAWADAGGATLDLVDAQSHFLARIGDSMFLADRRPLPSPGSICAGDAARVVVAADDAFTLLDAGDLQPASTSAHLPGARPEGTTWRLGSGLALAAWNAPDGRVHYAVTGR
jgi:hypothetical protein